jgi:hypothetical protein
VDPPWASGGDRAVVGGLACDDPPTINWAPGERDAWLAMAATVDDPQPEPTHRGPGRAEASAMAVRPQAGAVTGGAEAGAVAVPGRGRPRRGGGREPAALLLAVATHELGALPTALTAAKAAPARCACALAPLVSAEVATLMAELLATRPTLRPQATAWLVRHATAAARALLPAALGRPGRPRWRAERALHTLAGLGHRATVAAVAAGYGPAAASATGRLLATDPADLHPVRTPAMPPWVDAGTLPAVSLAGGGTLPPPAVGHLLTLLALSSMDEPFPALGAVVAACDRGSIAAFGWALFER